jgi:hypothetical protein
MEITNKPTPEGLGYKSISIEKFVDEKGIVKSKTITVHIEGSCVDMICELDENDGDNSSAGFKLSVGEGGQIVIPGTIHIVGPWERKDIKVMLKTILEEIDF